MAGRKERPVPRRRPSPPADGWLWDRVTRDVKPLSGRASPSSPPAPAERAEPPEAETQAEPPADSAPRAPRRPSPPPVLPALAPGRVAGLDRRSALRLKRGQVPIERSVDLHGLTQDQASPALKAFLKSAQEEGCRCVLVVTGKGFGKEGAGVIKTMVPRWLNQTPNRERILAFAYAQPRHGGDGALYVLLRRMR